MNKGLKQHTKQLKHTVGDASTSINLFKNDGNMHILLPLIATTGLNPFETSLIFNYQDKDVDGIFGKGFKLNHYAKITKNGNIVTLQKILGHSSLQMTQNYINLLVSDMKKDVEEFNILREFKREPIRIA